MTGLDEATLAAHAWLFGRASGEVISPQLRFLSRGRLGLHHHDNEASWSLDGGMLRFHDIAGRVTTRFAQQVDGLALAGPYAGDASIVHTLRPVARVERLPETGEAVVPRARGTGGRRNLVVLRAGRSSLHTGWTRDVDPSERNWDLCISWYDRSCRLGIDPDADFEAMQAEDRKYPALWKLFGAGSAFWRYEHVMFPDDDLRMGWRDINRMFDIVRGNELLLAQPSLLAQSYVLHDLTRQRPDGLLRFTNFVEVMIPVFSREALGVCAPTFGLSPSAFGLDHVWPAMLGMPSARIAIVDGVAVAHTRPMGSAYDLDAARADGARVRALYGLREHFDERGRLYW